MIEDFRQLAMSYLGKVFSQYQHEDTPGMEEYCSHLKEFLEEAVERSREKNNGEKAIIQEREIIPGRHYTHVPRMRLWDGESKITGYIDILNPGIKNINPGADPRFSLYNQVFANLLITNFFIFYNPGEDKKRCVVRPFHASFSGDFEMTVKIKNIGAFFKLLENFINNSSSEIIKWSCSYIRLQQHLALKTFYLREYVLLPILKNRHAPGIDGELLKIYQEYSNFFSRELSKEEFSAFLSHVLVDGILRAVIFYRSVDGIDEAPLTRAMVYEYSRFMGIPSRRLAVFQYFCRAGSEIEKSCSTYLTGVYWMLDDITWLLSQFNYQKMGFNSTNPGDIPGEQLQWAGYFFKPYYDSPAQVESIHHLLYREGIFLEC